MELLERAIKNKIFRFLITIVAWFFFSSAVITLGTALHRNVTGGFLGWQTEVPICGYMALCFSIWWYGIKGR